MVVTYIIAYQDNVQVVVHSNSEINLQILHADFSASKKQKYV